MKTHIVQLGMCTADLSRTIRRYCEGFGFQDAGGRMTWGARLAAIQALGSDMTAAIWWLVGKQPFLNLELFHHSVPPQRPLPDDWRPNCLGWVRWGFAVADFDAAVAYLQSVRINLSEVVRIDNLRRICFRDPDIGVVVEVMEEGAALPGFDAFPSSDGTPRIVYATLSVPDLTAAQAFYIDSMTMAPVPEQLHTPDMEALWGLPGARREIAVLDGGRGMFLELVQYTGPHYQRRTDLRSSDQGIMNIAIGYRERAAAEHAITRAIASGATLNAPLGNTVTAATYINDPLGNSLELLYIPEHLEASFGWAPQPIVFR